MARMEVHYVLAEAIARHKAALAEARRLAAFIATFEELSESLRLKSDEHRGN